MGTSGTNFILYFRTEATGFVSGVFCESSRDTWMLREKDPTLPKFHERDGEREERMGSMKSFGNGSLKHHFRARSSALIYNLPMSFPKSDRQDRDALVPQMSEGLARPGDHVISLGQVPVLFHTLKKTRLLETRNSPSFAAKSLENPCFFMYIVRDTQ